MHRNPVKRELVSKPEDWIWSSFRRYATGEDGVVEIESERTGRRCERMGMPLRVKIVGGPVRFRDDTSGLTRANEARMGHPPVVMNRKTDVVGWATRLLIIVAAVGGVMIQGELR